MSDPVSEYVRFIDGLVALRESDSAAQVRDGVWHRQRASDPLKLNELLGGLAPQQRAVLAEIVQGAVDTAICDLLVFLADQGYRLSRGGVELAVRPSGKEMNEDFLARRDGRQWQVMPQG